MSSVADRRPGDDPAEQRELEQARKRRGDPGTQLAGGKTVTGRGVRRVWHGMTKPGRAPCPNNTALPRCADRHGAGVSQPLRRPTLARAHTSVVWLITAPGHACRRRRREHSASRSVNPSRTRTAPRRAIAGLRPCTVVDQEIRELLVKERPVAIPADGTPDHVTRIGQNPFSERTPRPPLWPQLQRADQHPAVVGEAVREGVPPAAGDRDRTCVQGLAPERVALVLPLITKRSPLPMPQVAVPLKNPTLKTKSRRWVQSGMFAAELQSKRVSSPAASSSRKISRVVV